MRRASDSAIAAAIKRHADALAALQAHVAGQADINDRDPVFRRLERTEMTALLALVALTPTTIASVRAVARHLRELGPVEEWPNGIVQRLLRALAV